MYVLPNAPSSVAAQCCLLVVAPGLVRWTVLPLALVLVAWWQGLVLVAVSGRWSQECDLLALQVVLQGRCPRGWSCWQELVRWMQLHV